MIRRFDDFRLKLLQYFLIKENIKKSRCEDRDSDYCSLILPPELDFLTRLFFGLL